MGVFIIRIGQPDTVAYPRTLPTNEDCHVRSGLIFQINGLHALLASVYEIIYGGTRAVNSQERVYML